MDTTAERTVSGRTLVVVGLVVAVLVTAASLIWGPGLREDVRQEQDPRTLREPVATGLHAGQPWEAVGRYDGTSNCVELRYLAEILDRACDTGPTQLATSLPDGGPTIAYGVAPEEESTFAVRLADGEELSAPVVAGELGFPVGFWAVELPAGAELAEP